MKEKQKDYREPRREVSPAEQVSNVRARIWRILKDAGIWDSTLTYQVEMAATNIVVYRMLKKEVLSLPSLTIQITRDNGSEAPKPHPLLLELREQGKVVEKNMDFLLMNVKSKKGKEAAADSLKEFMAKMSEV